MKAVRNESPFSGWKEFVNGFETWRFEDKGSTWHVYRNNGGTAFIHSAVIDKVRGESNRSLLNRGMNA